MRDQVVDCVQYWSDRAEQPIRRMVSWLGISRSKYYQWRRRYGKVNEHNAWVPRDGWLEDWEKEAIVRYCQQHRNEGYRRLTYRMLDEDIVAVSPSSVYRVLRDAGLLRRWNRKTSEKGKGFAQPTKAHEHWHVDISYLNIHGTFYYLCSVLDGYSRFMVEWDIGASMTEREVEMVLQRARERFPDAHPRIISDNGPQFIAKDFAEFIRHCGMTHVRTSPHYPQSNGKVERYHGTLRRECLRPRTPLSAEDALRIIDEFVQHYNERRLHSALGYITPRDMLEGRAQAIFAARARKLREARERRRRRRPPMKESAVAQADDESYTVQQSMNRETIHGSPSHRPVPYLSLCPQRQGCTHTPPCS